MRPALPWRVLSALGLTLCAADALVAQRTARPAEAAAPVDVRLNQVGYLPDSSKRATIVSDAKQPLAWELRDSGRSIAASGNTTIFGVDADSGDHVHIADFTRFTREGTGYTLRVGESVSHPFDISRSVYHRLRYDALAYFYQTRSGIPIEMPYAGGVEWERPAGHAGVAPNRGDTSVPCAADAGCSYTLDVSGGWYDAGDHGKYVVNGGIAVWTLLSSYERAMYPSDLYAPDRKVASTGERLKMGPGASGPAAYADGTMNIPERHNRMPDLLDEVRWELEFLMKMQVPAGQPHAGMAHHKVHDVQWTPLPTRPELDPQERRLRPVSTAATLNLAAAAAQGARLWKDIDRQFSARCLAAAETAWAAAQANPAMLAPPSDSAGGGSYSDRTIADEQYWAASELYVTTGRQTYRNFITASELFRTISAGLTSMTWSSTAALGSISLATVPNGLSADDISAIRRNIITAADGYVKTADAQGYGVPLDHRYQWGSNSVVLNNALIMALAFDFTRSPRYRDGVVRAMDYVLGRNAMDKSYVSGYGERPLTNPHHRFWTRQADRALPGPPPGVLAGGPNSALQDSRAKTLAGCAPQKCYVDHYQAYSLNEVCLNWNAPLAWVAGWLDETLNVER